MDRFQICFICSYPTTDWSANEVGEPVCGMCWAEQPTEEEIQAVYYSLAEHWEEDMKAMLSEQ